MSTRSLLVGLAGVVSVLLAAGCSPDKPSSGTVSSPAAPPSTAPSDNFVGTADSDALTAYRGMWRAFVEAGKTSDAESAEVRHYTAGTALKRIVGSLYADKELGKVTKGDVALKPTIIKRTPETAPTALTVEDCVDSTRWLKYKATGGLWDDKPGGKHRTTATVKKQDDGVWKVDSFVLERSGTC